MPVGHTFNVRDRLPVVSCCPDRWLVHRGRHRPAVRGGLKGIPQHATETGAVIKAHIRSTAVADLHFQGHRAHVGEQLNAAKGKAFAGGHLGGQRFEIRKQRMWQRELRADVGPTCISVVTDLPQGDARRTHLQCTGPSARRQLLPRSMAGASGKASPGCSAPRPSES